MSCSSEPRREGVSWFAYRISLMSDCAVSGCAVALVTGGRGPGAVATQKRPKRLYGTPGFPERNAVRFAPEASTPG